MSQPCGSGHRDFRDGEMWPLLFAHCCCECFHLGGGHPGPPVRCPPSRGQRRKVLAHRRWMWRPWIPLQEEGKQDKDPSPRGREVDETRKAESCSHSLVPLWYSFLPLTSMSPYGEPAFPERVAHASQSGLQPTCPEGTPRRTLRVSKNTGNTGWNGRQPDSGSKPKETTPSGNSKWPFPLWPRVGLG